MAVIYLARDPLMKRLVAIKVMPRKFTFDPTFRARFEREAEVIAALEHPAIVPIYDFGEDDGRPYFVMRYMPGGSLAAPLKRGPLSLHGTIRIINRIAPALGEAHKRGIIHRDLKPANILFDQRKDAYLADFGIVKFEEESTVHTEDIILGTPAYLSPELARGVKNIDGRSDVYALGVLIFRMLTGLLPFTADSAMGMAMKHVTEPVPNILDFQPTLPPEVQTVVATAMAKERDKRYASAVALAAALEMSDNGGTIPMVLTSEKIADTQQLIPGDKPPGAAQSAQREPTASPPPNNLPPQGSSFIGRDTDLVHIANRLENPVCRLLTLLGPGGIGKTRLAIEAAARQKDTFPQGTFFIPLAPLSSAEFLVSTIAETIGFNFYTQEKAKTQLLNYLRGKEMLLVMDNFEHILEAADLLVEILQTAPKIHILATSRERLNLQEEWILHVHGMETPTHWTTEQIEAYPAIHLFVERARKVRPGFRPNTAEREQIVRICRLVEGMPLGIELAAAWVRILSCEEIANEIEENLDFLTTSLRNVTQRHRSLRAVFEYSWKLLETMEKEVYSKLTVFRGGFSRQAAWKVAGASLFHLSALVDKSLLRVMSSDRYELLEALRQYAGEKLAEDPERKTDAQNSHCDYFTAFLAKWEDAIQGGDQKAALEAIGTEIENVRSTWRWAVKTNNENAIARSLDSLYRFYEIRGWLQEGEEVFRSVSEQLRFMYGGTQALTEDKLILHAKVLSHQAAFLYRLGARVRARNLLEKAIDLLRPHDAREELAFALNYLGAVNFLESDYETAKTLLEESLGIFKEIDNRLGTAISLHHLGLVALNTKNFIEAQHFFQESYHVNQEIGDRFGVSISLDNLGIVARETGEYGKAKELHEKSLSIREESDDRWGIASSLAGLGLVAFRTHDYDKARQMLEQSMAIYREIGDHRRLKVSAENLRMANAALESRNE